MSTSKIGVIIGSTRPSRTGAQITDWVLANLPVNADVSYEVIDLAKCKDKPTLVVSYGYDGGVSANKQLREVFERIGTKATKLNPALVISQAIFGSDHKVSDVDTAFTKHKEDVLLAGSQLIDSL